jgi:hypothetical protein
MVRQVSREDAVQGGCGAPPPTALHLETMEERTEHCYRSRKIISERQAPPGKKTTTTNQN